MKQGEFDFCGQALSRDTALNLLAKHRHSLISMAKAIAEELAKENGSVNSTEVFIEMSRRGIEIGDIDKRFMGCVFRSGWKRIGFTSMGSHRRPVSIWKRL